MLNKTLFSIPLLIVLLSISLLFADNSSNTTQQSQKSMLEKVKRDVNTTLYQRLLLEKEVIDKGLRKNDLWSMYGNYYTFQELKKELSVLNAKIDRLKKERKRNRAQRNLLVNYKEEQRVLKDKLQLLASFENDPFKSYLTPPEIGTVPSVGNPFAIIGAFSYQKKLHQDQQEYSLKYDSLKNIVTLLKDKTEVLKTLKVYSNIDDSILPRYEKAQEQLKTFLAKLEIYETTHSVYEKSLEEAEHKLQKEIQDEIEKTISLGGMVLFFLILLLAIKYFTRKYLLDNERLYMINKAINFGFISIILLLLLFFYIENVSYIVTILGFASAGIAIAMKDWFMSIMGWLTMMIGGSVHAGDRIRVLQNGVEYVGDVMDISMLRITLHEDITLTTTMVNRRAGRIIFIPNNFIFTDMIANYGHAGLKTVWDGIDFVVTFDSDVYKATSIAKEVAKKYSKGYTDITRKQLNKLRSQYHMKNTNVEPRIFTFIEPYGLKVSVWYLTNSYATLTLRSTISTELIHQINTEKSVQLAYPSQSIFMDKYVAKPPFDEDGNETDRKTNSLL
jgi:small-conductance mechanosensitive channel